MSSHLAQIQVKPSEQPSAQVQPVLIDGAIVMLILTSIVGLAKLVLPQWFSDSSKARAAKLEIELQDRKQGIANDRESNTVVNGMLDQMSRSMLSQSSLLTDALVTKVLTTLDAQAALTTRSMEIMNSIAKSQATTQELLDEIQQDVAKLRDSGRRRDRRQSDIDES